MASKTAVRGVKKPPVKRAKKSSAAPVRVEKAVAPSADSMRAESINALAATPHDLFDASSWWSALAQMPALPAMSVSPARVQELQQSYVQHLSQLWSDFLEHPEKTTEPIKDNRFSDPAWQKSSLASFYARAYLLNADFMQRLAESVETDRKTRQRVKFMVSQWVDAASPSNYLALNPKAQQTLLESGGDSLRAGIKNLLGDIGKGKITQSDESAFEIGRNVATSEGAVVFENALIQLIQYKPLTVKVHKQPLVIVPPCINKFYILDLQPENSLVRNCVEQGHTVFLVSWKNPHEAESRKTWDDYIELGPIAAIHVAQSIGGEKQVNALGFCVGGTIVTTALSVLAARGENPVASLTLLTALLDFEDPGVLDIFIDEQHVRMRERTIGTAGKGGLMPGRDLANTFSSLRANDLVWPYVVANYLEGKQPPAFDLLYWNGDSTNLPGPMYAWYLRNTYLENNLREPCKVKTAGQPVDLRQITMPVYAFAAREDHIVPWKGAYASARWLPGAMGPQGRFVLGASGHIAGTVNSARKNKRSYWAAESGGKAGNKSHALPADPEAWLAGANEYPGSWWNDWNKWLTQFGGSEKPAPKSYGNAKYKVIEPAPGRYVKEKA